MQYKKIVLGALVGIGMVGSLLPVMAAAITTTELVNLFVALGIIAPDKAALALQVVGADGQSGTSASLTTVPPQVPGTSSGNACASLSRVLSHGDSDATTGSEVSKLQAYLRSTGDFTYSDVTGFYGAATVQAVQKWQARNAIVAGGSSSATGYGAFGPRSLAFYKAKCTSQPTSVAEQGSFSLTPLSGNAPLTVTGTVTLVLPAVEPCGMLSAGTIAWGDGSTSSLTRLGCSGQTTVTASHTYNAGGVFTAVYTTASGIKLQDTVTVTSLTTAPPSTASFSASPISGTAPLSVQFYNMYTNGRSAVSMYTIDFGDGTYGSPTPCYAPADVCVSAGVSSHTYSTAGSYFARFLRDGSPVWSQTITVSTTAVTPTPTASLSVSPTSGTAPLAVTFYGASSMSGSWIAFGDGSTSSSLNTGSFTQAHTYASAGTYTAILYRPVTTLCTSCGDGAAAQVTVTVTQPSTAPTPPSVGNTLSASQSSSASTNLIVNFTGNSVSTYGYTLDFGDPRVVSVLNVDPLNYASVSSTNVGSFSQSHRYSAAGTYTAKLYAACAPNAKCSALTLTAQTTVTVR